MNKLNNPFAFPLSTAANESGCYTILDANGGEHLTGMKLLDYFAAKATDDFDIWDEKVQEAFVGRKQPNCDKEPIKYLQFQAEGSAKWRYMQAEEMLKQRMAYENK